MAGRRISPRGFGAESGSTERAPSETRAEVARRNEAGAASSYAENEEPQPQVLFVFGFENLKPEPCKPST